MGAATIFGQRLANRYQVIRELADGSAGMVYLAQDLATRQNVVVKVLVPELSFDSRTLPHLRQRLQRRLKIQPREGSALSHIVDITDVGLMSSLKTPRVTSPTSAEITTTSGPTSSTTGSMPKTSSSSSNSWWPSSRVPRSRSSSPPLECHARTESHPSPGAE